MVPRFLPMSWEIVYSDSAVNIIEGDDGDNGLTGSPEDDRMKGGRGDDILTGDWGDDWLFGFDDNDELYGDVGDDRLQGGFDQVTLLDFFQGGDHAVDQLAFASGGAISADQIFGAFGLANPDPVGSPDYPNLPDEQYYGTVTLGDAANTSYLAASGADFIDAGAGDDLLQSGTGDDYLIGGYGSDLYLIGHATGHDTINNYDADDMATDTVRFEEAAIEDLWFSRNGNDLAISLAGTDDQVTVAHWYDGSSNEVDRIEAAGSVLLNNQVDQLVAAMAVYDVPAGVGNVIPQNVQDSLQPILVENWQAIA